MKHRGSYSNTSRVVGVVANAVPTQKGILFKHVKGIAAVIDII